MPPRPRTAPAQPQIEKRGAGRWLIASFQPVSLFSLRMTRATNKGGKTLLVPTPYAFKMALIDVCFRAYGPEQAHTKAVSLFNLIKGRDIRILPPENCIIQNTFIKILDHFRESDLPFRQTIAYREFAYYDTEIRLALGIGGMADAEIAAIQRVLPHLNSIGKRGGFIQFDSVEIHEGDLPVGFTVPLSDLSNPATYAVVQELDDFGPALCTAADGFNRISTYGTGAIKLGEHRILVPTAIPYRRRTAARAFTWYQRTDVPPA